MKNPIGMCNSIKYEKKTHFSNIYIGNRFTAIQRIKKDIENERPEKPFFSFSPFKVCHKFTTLFLLM